MNVYTRFITKDEMNQNKPVVGRYKKGLNFQMLHDTDIM